MRGHTFAIEMRPTIAAILLLLLTLQVTYKGIVFSSYFANKAYIAAVLCENRDRPELECEGKCYLKNQLQKADAPESNASGLSLKLEISPFTAPTIFWSPLLPAKPETTLYYTFSSGAYLSAYLSDCFHPPRI
ncbi:hypothetical protein SAMN05421739_1011028 [Pontibacter chinhatensis]|uniref:Uncharacterized protein n=2 Tax=Pontibacter chinhatensis TaxID=1436961 RepID=A0A1I2PMR5_9BACT|nr:hypothetical protein SAMN05421739_1011028 [Pontibacter chinhatensis]